MADSELRRTHPLTVLVRGATVLAQASVAFLVFGLSSLANGGLLAALGMVGVILVIAGIAAGGVWLNWHFFRYGIVGGDLVIHEGWLVKKHRSVPLARVQGVDIRADLLSRLLGLANVVVQTAGGGGGEAEATIGSIPLGDAERLRAQLISGRAQVATTAAGVSAELTSPGEVANGGASPTVGADPLGHMSDFRGVVGGSAHVDEEPGYEHSVSVGTLVVAALTSTGVSALAVIVVVVTAGALVVVPAVGRAAGWEGTASASTVVLSVVAGFGFPMALVAGSTLFAVISRDFGFKIRRVGERLETESGLLERRMTSVPVRRIQAVVIDASALRRLLKLASVRIHTAGFGQGEEEQASTAPALVPLARTTEIRPLLHRLVPEAEQFPHTKSLPVRSLRFYLLFPTLGAAVATAALVTTALLSVSSAISSEALSLITPLIMALSIAVATGLTALRRGLEWRAAGVGLDSRAIAIRFGSFGLHSVRVSRSRIQSLAIRQSFFQRRAQLATLQISTVSGSSKALYRVRHLPVDDAATIERWYSPDRAPSVEPPAATVRQDASPQEGS